MIVINAPDIGISTATIRIIRNKFRCEMVGDFRNRPAGRGEKVGHVVGKVA